MLHSCGFAMRGRESPCCGTAAKHPRPSSTPRNTSYGWGGAAGTVAFVDMKRGLRAGMYTQYMPAETYPLHAEFPKAVVADLMAVAQG